MRSSSWDVYKEAKPINVVAQKVRAVTGRPVTAICQTLGVAPDYLPEAAPEVVKKSMKNFSNFWTSGGIFTPPKLTFARHFAHSRGTTGRTFEHSPKSRAVRIFQSRQIQR